LRMILLIFAFAGTAMAHDSSSLAGSCPIPCPGLSVALRLALPLVGAWIGGQFGPTREQCGDCDAQDEHAYRGFAVGVVTAMALDTWLLAGDDDSREPAIVPSVRAANGGVSLGLSGRF